MPVPNDKSVVQNSIRRKMIGKYFAITRDFGINPLEAKNKAKKKFGLAHFDDITDNQLGDLLAEIGGDLG